MANIDLIKRRVILCAGHGGGDPGSVGQGTSEAAEVIDIVNRAVDFLRRDGQVEVIHVPNELSFEQSIAWVNARYKDIDDGVAIDVHKNAFVGAKGVETWYADDPDSRLIAQRIQARLAAHRGPDRGVKPDTQNRWGRLGWCRDVNLWAPLVEAWFVSDGGDPVGGTANQGYAEALSRGILNIWNLAPRVVTVPVPAPTSPTVTWQYKVVSTADGKQLGVYNQKPNAWAKYMEVRGAAKIVNPAGADLTPAFVLEFGVKEPLPQTYASKEEVEALRTRTTALEKMWADLKSFFNR